MLDRLGRFCARHRRWVALVWVVIAVVVGVVGGKYGVATDDDFSIPGTDSQAALDILQADFPSAAGAAASVVYQAPAGKTISDFSTEITSTVQALEQLPDVATVGNPATTAPLVSKDGTIAYSPVNFTQAVTDIPDDTFTAMASAIAPAQAAGLTVALGGGVVDAQNIPTSTLSDHADEIGILIAIIILLFAFGSVLHMALPIGSAIFGVGLLTVAMLVVEHFVSIPSVAPILGTMIGLGVGVDYGLFIVTRYRTELAGGLEVEAAVGRALGTAGRAVVFAGATVCISTSALVLVGIPIVGKMGVVAAGWVFVMVIVSLTFLPALMGFAGHRIETWKIPGLGGRHHEHDPDKPRGFARLAIVVADHAWAFAIGTFLLLLVMAVPVLHMEIGFTDDGDAPPDSTQYQAYELMAQGFGPGVNGPLLVVAQTDQPASSSGLSALGKALSDTPGVASAVGPLPATNGQASLFLVTPTTGPADEATTDLVSSLRSTVIPNSLAGTDVSASSVHVGGPTATNIDLTEKVADALPKFIAAVLAGSFLLLMVVFHSLLVPLKAVIMNLLSIGAAYGIVVAVFQWGWAKDLVGLDRTIHIWSFVPLMMFAILFGLSMDYEVFLMTRMQEAYEKSKNPRESVITAVGATARVITSAALVMIAVFLAFVTNPSAIVKMIGLGLAAAVFVDATIVRVLLVPSVMELLGHRAWWLPKWLDKILPKVSLEG